MKRKFEISVYDSKCNFNLILPGIKKQLLLLVPFKEWQELWEIVLEEKNLLWRAS